MLKTSIVASANNAYWDLDKLNSQSELMPETRVKTLTGTYSFSSTINHKFSKKITNRSGLLIHNHFYDLKSQEAIGQGGPLRTIVEQEGSSYRYQVFTNTV